MINDINKRVFIWRFTLVLIKINHGQIGDQTGLFYTTNPVFYTSGNRFVRRTVTFGNLIFSLVPSDNRNTRSTCPMSVFTGTRQSDKRRGLYCRQHFYMPVPCARYLSSFDFFMPVPCAGYLSSFDFFMPVPCAGYLSSFNFLH
jgi:hypothetical protein